MSERAEISGVPSQEERVMAAIAHATVIWPTLGLVAPLVLWGTQREKSPFVGFQALQAAAYQFVLLLAGLVVGACYMCSFFSLPATSLLALPFDDGAAVCLPFFAFSCTFGMLFLLMLAWLAYVGYGLFGAVWVLQGSDFRYVVLGPWLDRYLKQS